MDFVEDVFGQAGDVSNDLDKVTEFIGTEVSALSDRRERQRVISDAQVRVSDIQSKICDSVRAKAGKTVLERIADLRNSSDASDRELYQYIWNLMTLKYSIWCVQCDSVKRVGGRDPQVVEAEAAAELGGEQTTTHAAKKDIPLSRNNPLADLLSPEDRARAHQMALIHGTAHNSLPAIDQQTVPMIEQRAQPPKAQPAIEQRAATTKSNAVAKPSATPAATNKKQTAEKIDPETINEKIAKIKGLRDDIAGQLRQIDAYVVRLEKIAQPANSAGNGVTGGGSVEDIIARAMSDTDESPPSFF